MKVNNLFVGQVVKNYGELCSLLEVKKTTGEAKILQLKELERFIKYEKESYKFIIREIYSLPLPKNNNITKYVPLIEKLILHLIITESDDNNRLYINTNKLLKTLQMINEQYSKMKYKNMQLSHSYNIPKETIIDFYTTSDRLLKRNLENALNSLQNQSLIKWNNVFSVCQLEYEKNFATDIVIVETQNKYGDIETTPIISSKKVRRTHREATKEETEYILYMQRETLLAMECKSISEVIKKGLGKEFYDRVYNAMLLRFEIEKYYNAYSITYNIEHVIKQYNDANIFLLDDESKEITSNLLNNSIARNISNNGARRYGNSLKDNKNTYRLYKNFTSDIDKLSNGLIRVNINKE